MTARPARACEASMVVEKSGFERERIGILGWWGGWIYAISVCVLDVVSDGLVKGAKGQ